MIPATRQDAERLDAADPLAPLRARFVLPDHVIYLDGNSLGALPAGAAEAVGDAVRRQWGEGLIRSWNAAGWIEAPARIGAKIAPLIGAQADEVTVADSTTVNLYKLAAGAAALRPDRRVILTEAGNFPTDLYVLQGLAQQAGLEVRALPREAIEAAIDTGVALIVLTHVHYKSAQRWPMAAICARAQAAGALTLWDLSHSAGALALDLDGAGADLAVGCGYKYLNGGPGAPSFVFVARRHHAALSSPIWGWMGHAAPFDFVDDHAPAPGVRRQLAGTPPILGLAALEAGLATFEGVAMAALEAKAGALGDLFIALAERRCAGLGLTLASPREAASRASHVSFRHADGYGLVQALIARGVIGDFRAPDIARFGLTPLYLRFVDVWDAVEQLRQTLEAREPERPEFRRRLAVT